MRLKSEFLEEKRQGETTECTPLLVIDENI